MVEFYPDSHRLKHNDLAYKQANISLFLLDEQRKQKYFTVM